MPARAVGWSEADIETFGTFVATADLQLSGSEVALSTVTGGCDCPPIPLPATALLSTGALGMLALLPAAVRIRRRRTGAADRALS